MTESEFAKLPDSYQYALKKPCMILDEFYENSDQNKSNNLTLGYVSRTFKKILINVPVFVKL